MFLISATDEWRAAHSGGVIGLLELSGVDNTVPSPKLDQRKRETEARLREKYSGFSRQDFLALPVMAAYDRYYRKFTKTYHVLQQVESIALKGRDLPNVSPLVDSNFTAEVDTLVLTAGHDVAKLHEPISFDVSREGDSFIQMNGQPKTMAAGDMVMRDAQGLCCSIIYGQDNRSPITAATTHVLYVSYVPPGVPRDAVEEQLTGMEENVRLFSPLAVLERREFLIA
jgi:DNA/RNA-binding domain of Phe-tRNA-synthetase-like protein